MYIYIYIYILNDLSNYITIFECSTYRIPLPNSGAARVRMRSGFCPACSRITTI